MKKKFTTKKSLGQNWLINPVILDKIIFAGEINKSDVVLEIGPGTGNLTEKLAEHADKIIAIEKDRRLIEYLERMFETPGPDSTAPLNKVGVEIVEGDILKLNIKKLLKNSKLKIEDAHYKIVGNIPYYITSRLLRKIFEEWPWPELIVLTIQKEVAQRIMAKPPRMNLLALSVQYYSEPKIISYVSKNNFRPVPKVDSAIIKLSSRGKQAAKEETEKLFRFMKAGFAGKRKQLAGNLERGLELEREKILEAFEKAGIIQTARAENLSLDKWQELLKLL